MTTNKGYLGNQNLKPKDLQISWTKEKIQEFVKCKNDVKYFAENYFKIIHADLGLVDIELYDYQKEILDDFQQNLRVCLLQCRQSGKCFCEDSKMLIRNKKTGETVEVTAKQFHEMTKTNQKVL